LHVSTDEVFGSAPPGSYFSEQTKYQPGSPYSASKAASDHLAHAYFNTYNLPVLISNCSNNFGPYQFPEKLLPLMILNCLKGKPLPVYGDGKNVRDWLFVKDHCRALSLIIEKGQPGESYCVGGDAEKENIEIIEHICQIMDSKIPERSPHKSLIEYIKDRPGHDRRYAIDHAKITKELGWRPSGNFSVHLEATVEWYLQNETWWSKILSGEYTKFYTRQYGSHG
jgi:dTDP-glucose 4,6-dehydratase